MLEVESTVNIPQGTGRGRPSVYPFERMDVGDSFLVPSDRGMKARLAASAWKRNHSGWDYTSRQDVDGVRIWRTA